MTQLNFFNRYFVKMIIDAQSIKDSNSKRKYSDRHNKSQHAKNPIQIIHNLGRRITEIPSHD